MSTPTDEEFFRTGHWVAIEDQYDRDRFRYGPFPSLAAAAEFCDAWNGRQLKRPAGDPPRVIERITDVGVWSLATVPGHDHTARLLYLLSHPEIELGDPDELLARSGARPDYQWRREMHEALAPDRCYCVALAQGRIPDAPALEISAYLSQRLERRRDLFSTDEHFGDASVDICRVCGGALLHLLVELEGFGNAIHHYYTPLTGAGLAALEDGTIDGSTLEAWLGARAGIHRDGAAARFYRRVRVGYPGMDHAILD